MRQTENEMGTNPMTHHLKRNELCPHKGTEPETLMEPVTGIEPATH